MIDKFGILDSRIIVFAFIYSIFIASFSPKKMGE